MADVYNYNEKVKKQREVFSQIDSAMAILEILPDFVDTTLDFLNANSFTYSESPLGLLFNILHVLGVDEVTLRGWITDILVYVLPTVEIGIKASLLSNIKSIVSCNSDPRIPLYLRKKVSEDVYTNVLTGLNEERGIDVNIDVIDPDKILDLSPFTEPGNHYYFGVDENDNEEYIEKLHKLVRADDFNAFLWYVIHRGNRQNPIQININGGIFEYNGKTYTITSKNTDSLFGLTEIICNGGESDFIPGTTIFDGACPNNIAICIEARRNDDNKIVENTFVSISSDWFSCNWYADKTNYYSKNLGVKENKKRSYREEKAICNIRYVSQSDYPTDRFKKYPDYLRFSILPKPYVLLPSLIKDNNALKTQWRPIRLLFDSEGNPDQNGKFSLISETYDLQPTLSPGTLQGDELVYDVKGITTGGVHLTGAKLKVNIKTGQYELTNITNINSILVECYPGLTIYEFNYDFIMGMKLFSPKAICQKIFDNAANPRFNSMFTLTLNKTTDNNTYPYLSGKQRVLEIVRSIIEDDSEINDCFFRFSNEQYDEMLKKTEEIRYRQLPYNQGYNNGYSINFEEVDAILSKITDETSLEEQKSIINNAIEVSCATLEDRDNVTALSDKSTTNVDFLTNVLQQLTATIVDAVLSPKVLLLLYINNELMGNEVNEAFNTEALFKILKNVIKSLVKEVRDLIMQKLLDYILAYLKPLARQLQVKIFSEQFAAYMAIIRLLLGYANKGVETVSRLNSVLSSINSRFGGDGSNNTEIDLPTVLDNILYADIYVDDSKDKQPIINC